MNRNFGAFIVVFLGVGGGDYPDNIFRTSSSFNKGILATVIFSIGIDTCCE